MASCVFTEEYPALSKKNLRLSAQKLFREHTPEQKKSLMQGHCAQIQTEKVAAYCHYCIRGLKLGGAKAFHLAELLFEEGEQY